MGSPASGVLAEFILRPLEDRIFSELRNTPKTWLRYADDIFIIWDDRQNLDVFVEDVNAMEPRIQFELERQTGGILNFLDVKMEKKNGKIVRDVYRKEIANINVIPRTSHTFWKYKESTFNHMVRRAHDVCSRATLQIEIKRIENIAEQAGYDRAIIRKMERKVQGRRLGNNTERERVRIKGSIDYHKGLTEKVKRIFKREQVDIAIKNDNKLIANIRNEKNVLPDEEKNGVYQIPFIDRETGREEVYIGQTKRKMGVRRKEHIRDVRQATAKSELARRAQEADIDIKFEQAKIIAPYTGKPNTELREAIEILTTENACNKTTSINIPGIWTRLLKKETNRRRRELPVRNQIPPQIPEYNQQTDVKEIMPIDQQMAPLSRGDDVMPRHAPRLTGEEFEETRSKRRITHPKERDRDDTSTSAMTHAMITSVSQDRERMMDENQDKRDGVLGISFLLNSTAQERFRLREISALEEVSKTNERPPQAP